MKIKIKIPRHQSLITPQNFQQIYINFSKQKSYEKIKIEAMRKIKTQMQLREIRMELLPEEVKKQGVNKVPRPPCIKSQRPGTNLSF